MADTPVRIAGPTLLTGSAVTQYTVPASTTTILRDLRAANTTGTSASIFVSIGADAAGTRLWSGLFVPANGTLDWTGFIVLATGETFRAYSGTASALTLTASGVEVT